MNKIRGKLVFITTTLAKPLARLGVSPNAVTLLSMILLITGVILLVYTSSIPLFIVFIALSSLLDALDGALARLTGRTSIFGAFIDSTIDRVNDALMIASLLYLGLNQLYVYAFLALSLLVSYTRARAESLGVQLSGVGLMERPERVIGVVILLAIYMMDPTVAGTVLLVLVFLSTITLLQRIIQVYRSIQRKAVEGKAS